MDPWSVGLLIAALFLMLRVLWAFNVQRKKVDQVEDRFHSAIEDLKRWRRLSSKERSQLEGEKLQKEVFLLVDELAAEYPDSIFGRNRDAVKLTIIQEHMSSNARH